MHDLSHIVREFFERYERSRNTMDASLIDQQYPDAFMFAGPAGARIAEKQVVMTALTKGHQWLKTVGHRSTTLTSLHEMMLDERGGAVGMAQRLIWPALVLGVVAIICGATLTAQRPKPASTDKTIVVMLGTGNPSIDPDRSGPATAIVVNDTAYLVDFGAGVVRRAQEAMLAREIKAIDPTRLRVVFATHLHSDHTVGYADLILTPWVMGRRLPLEVYGPKGTEAMTRHVLDAYRVDTEARTGPEGMTMAAPDAYRVNAHEIQPGVVYQDANVTVTAFRTHHAIESYGYRFDTADRRVVVAGDTSPAQTTIDACNGCDVLIHEAISPVWTAAMAPARREAFEKFSAKYHTTPAQLGELASKARPKLLVLYHYSANSPEDLNAEMRAVYAGHFTVSRDLDVY